MTPQDSTDRELLEYLEKALEYSEAASEAVKAAKVIQEQKLREDPHASNIRDNTKNKHK